MRSAMNGHPATWLFLLGGIPVFLSGSPVASAQQAGDPAGPQISPSAIPAPTPVDMEHLSAAQAVRRGNRFLKNGNPEEALTAYRRAHELDPDAPQIDFVKGLAEYQLGKFDDARELFENAASASDPRLVDDAIYSIGTTFHQKALDQAAEPQARINALEDAMRKYRTVLDNRPEHAAARDANFKAASTWRMLREQQQQQQQQQDNQDENQDENQEQQDQEQQQQDQENEQQDEQQQQQQNQEEQQQQQSQSEQNDEQQQQEAQQQQQEEKEELSREQAERRLREMMQALRDRKKRKEERKVPVRIVPVDKDW